MVPSKTGVVLQKRKAWLPRDGRIRAEVAAAQLAQMKVDSVKHLRGLNSSHKDLAKKCHAAARRLRALQHRSFPSLFFFFFVCAEGGVWSWIGVRMGPRRHGREISGKPLNLPGGRPAWATMVVLLAGMFGLTVAWQRFRHMETAGLCEVAM